MRLQQSSITVTTSPNTHTGTHSTIRIFKTKWLDAWFSYPDHVMFTIERR
jgi:hypothetical protein